MLMANNVIYLPTKPCNMYVKKLPEQLEYGVNVTIKVLGGKWKACLLDSIHSGIRRPSELHRGIPGSTLRVLNQQLREMEELNIIIKKVYHEVPPKVEYYLTEWGFSLVQVMRQMDDWGNGYYNREQGSPCCPVAEEVAVQNGHSLAGVQ